MRRRLASLAAVAALVWAPAFAQLPAPGGDRDGGGARDAEREAMTDADDMAGEEVVAALSRNRVSITTTFAGSEIFVFGAVKRMAAPYAGELDVIVAVTGPSTPIVVRRKAQTLGVWTNRDEVRVDAAPSYYAVAATGPLDEILSHTDDLRYRIGLDRQVRLVGAPADVSDPEAFRRAVIRLRREAGLYYEAPAKVTVQDRTLFAVSFGLPANLVEGDYRARVFLLHDRQVVDVHEGAIAVRREGLERFLFSLSREDPLLYGVMSVIIALVAGWAASEAFRLMRR